MANPTPVTGIRLTSSQQTQMRRLLRKGKQREKARLLREGMMSCGWPVGEVGLCDRATAASSMNVESVQVEGQEVHDNVTYFRLRVYGSTGLQWHVLRRFSEFDSLRTQLDVRDERVGTIFPQKTWFLPADHALFRKLFLPQTRFPQKTFLRKQRQQLLEIWINGLLREFASGGDGRNSLIAMNWTNKLTMLHSFFGVESTGRLLPHARLVEAVPAIEDAAPANSTLAPSPWATASAPPMEEAIAEPVMAPTPLEAAADVAVVAAPVSPSADDEDKEFRAALVASVTSYAEEQAGQRAALAASVTLYAEEQARQKVMEEARLAAEDEEPRGNAKAALEQMAAEAEELRRSAHLAAEEEAARLIAEKAEAKRIKNAEMLATRRKMEEEIQARREAEEEEAQRKAKEEAAKRKSEEEETRQKAEEQAKKPWLEQALEMAGLARQFEDQGHIEQALDHYKKCIAMFMMAWQKETSEKVKGAIQEKVADMTRHTKDLTAVIMSAEVARVAEIMSVPVPVGYPDVVSLESCVDMSHTTVEAPIVTVATSAPARAPIARNAVAS